jgi:hypothetical protein
METKLAKQSLWTKSSFSLESEGLEGDRLRFSSQTGWFKVVVSC